MKINWKKFLKWELYATLFIGLLYLNSLRVGNNVFPENFFVVFLIPAIFGIMMLVKTHTKHLETKLFKSKK